MIKSLFYRLFASVALVSMQLVSFSSCSDDPAAESEILPEPGPGPEAETDPTPETIDASLLVYHQGYSNETTAKIIDFAIEHINQAQQGRKPQIRIKYEFAEQADNLFDVAASNYLLGGKYPIIIGPKDLTAAKRLIANAQNCYKSMAYSTILFPTVTSAEHYRKYSQLPYVKYVCCDNRHQLYAALRMLRTLGCNKYVNLVCSDDTYGDTFYTTFTEAAGQLGFEWTQYKSINPQGNGLICIPADMDEESLVNLLSSYYGEFIAEEGDASDIADYPHYIVASSNPNHALYIDRLVDKWTMVDASPNVLIIDAGDALNHVDDYKISMGITLSCDPANTAFAEQFKERFGRYPINGESFIYDAVLATYHAFGGDLTGLRGASSDWTNDQTGSDYIETFFSLCDMTENEASPYAPVMWVRAALDRNSTGYLNIGAHRDQWIPIESSSVNSEVSPDSLSAEPASRWALLIAGTRGTGNKGWGTNFRHQADVWNMYHLLKDHGYPEGHIIVVTEDDIFGMGLFHEADDQRVIKDPHRDNANLYESIPSHYTLSQLSQQDITDILAGHKSERLPYVIESQADDNILIYWSGHGNIDGSLVWEGSDSEATNGEMTPDVFSNAIEEIDSADRYRRMLMIIEACYSGKFIKRLPMARNTLYLSAAEIDEQSYNDPGNIIILNNRSIFLFDDFSHNLIEEIYNNPHASLGYLFNSVYRLTANSHATMFNSYNYGPIFSLSIDDFVKQ